MTQYLGLQSLLNCSFEWSRSLLTRRMLQNPGMRTIQSV